MRTFRAVRLAVLFAAFAGVLLAAAPASLRADFHAEEEDHPPKPYIVPWPGLPIEDLRYSTYLSGAHGRVERSWREDAEAGDVAGMRNYGFWLAESFNPERDLEAAEIWLRKAAEAGDIQAKARLGWLLLAHGSDEAEWEQGHEMIEAAAATADPVAMFLAGLSREEFQGEEGSLEAALPFYRIAAESYYPAANRRLMDVHLFGQVPEADPAGGIRYALRYRGIAGPEREVFSSELWAFFLGFGGFAPTRDERRRATEHVIEEAKAGNQYAQGVLATMLAESYADAFDAENFPENEPVYLLHPDAELAYAWLLLSADFDREGSLVMTGVAFYPQVLGEISSLPGFKSFDDAEKMAVDLVNDWRSGKRAPMMQFRMR